MEGAEPLFLYRQDEIQPLSIILDAICSARPTTKAYAPYVNVRQDDYIRDICSHGSHSLKYCIFQSGRAALGASVPKIKWVMFFRNMINIFLVCSKNKLIGTETNFFVQLLGTLFYSTNESLLIPNSKPAIVYFITNWRFPLIVL